MFLPFERKIYLITCGEKAVLASGVQIVGRVLEYFSRVASEYHKVWITIRRNLRGCGGYQMWMCRYVQWVLSTARVESSIVDEQYVYALKLYARKPLITLGSPQIAASHIAEIYISD